MIVSRMAQIRFVDVWMRAPGAGPSHYRSVMVIAEKWAEQRVLMRAYAESRDQTRPTIMLHGIELAIGPAGIDVNGPWGIHVGDNPDGRAQEIKTHFEQAARRLEGQPAAAPRRRIDVRSRADRELGAGLAAHPAPAPGQPADAGRARGS